MGSMRLLTIAITLSLLTVSYLSIFSVGGTPVPILASRSALTDHNPILIQSDLEFNASNGVVSGDGSLSNPFIIENWSIDATDDNGIQIENTNSYFIIRNCSVGVPAHQSDYGILLNSVSNGTLVDLYIHHLDDGIYFFNSSHISVRNVEIFNMFDCGICIESSNNLTFYNFSIRAWTTHAVDILSAEDLHFDDFSIEDWGDGFHVSDCARSQFMNGQILESDSSGMRLQDSKGLLISNITITDSYDYGLRGAGLENVTIRGNNISNNWHQGLILTDHNDRISVLDNTFIHNDVGIDIQSTTNSSFIGNLVNGNSAGIMISSGSHNDTFYENEISNSTWDFGIDNWRGYPNSLDHRISDNNTINGKPIYFWTGQSHKTVPSNAGYVGLVNCDNITVTGQNLSHLWQGIIVNSSRDILVQDSYFTDDYDAMDLQNSSMDIVNNTLYQGLNENQYGLILDHMTKSTISNNTIDGTGLGMDLKSSTDVKIKGNSILNITTGRYWDSYGLYVGFSNNVSISNNTISHGPFYGIYVSQTTSVSFDGNTIDHLVHAIGVITSEANLTGNNINHCNYGIYLEGSKVDRIQNNQFYSNSGIGLQSYYLDETLVSNNTFINNYRGLAFNGINNTINSNLFLNNSIGIFIYTPNKTNNVIYNNFFNDTIDVNSAYKGNHWNISKQPGRSFMGGVFLGGNYWWNYTGQDLDGDYLGDTLIPFGPGDLHPLLLAPAIIDLTKETPRTGYTFEFNASLLFKEGLEKFTIEFWFDNGTHNLTPLLLTKGIASDGYYSLTIDVPLNASSLHYFLKAVSAKGQLAITNIRDLVVLDVLAPTIENLGSNPTTGDNYTLEIDFQDNRGFSNRTVDYWFDSGTRIRLDSLNITRPIVVPLGAHNLHFIANATDLSNNTASLDDTLTVKDNKLPIIVVISNRPGTGEQYRFRCNVTDNWAVGNVSMDYWFDGAKTHTSLTFTNGIYWTDVIPPLNTTSLHYSIRAIDGSGNLVWSNASQPVRDVVPPAIFDLSGVPTTGDMFEVKAEFSDIIDKEISSGILDYSFDQAPPMRVNFPGSFKVRVPDGARHMNYTIRCIDRGGNPTSLDKNVTVLDNDPPTLVDHSRGRPVAGRSYLLNVSAHDNISLTAVYAEYWFEGQKKRVDLQLQDGYYLGIITVPKGAEKLHYVLLAEDSSGNKASLPQKTLGLSTQTNYASSCVMIGLVLVTVAIILVVVNYSYQRNKLEKIQQKAPTDDEVMEMDASPAEEE
jgi:parallel beta-helix repeat protein